MKEMSIITKALVKKAIRNNNIKDHWYKDYNIKRGLRNEDGTGVKAILTEISDVVGYKVEQDQVIPVEGKLIYRGIELKELVEGFRKDDRHGFEETAYLLMFGELPSPRDLRKFSQSLYEQRGLPTGFVQHIVLPFPSADIMNKLQSNVTVLYRKDPNPDDICVENVIRQCISLIAKFPTIIAHAYQAKRYNLEGKSLYIHEPKEGLTTAETFLRMLREDKSYTPLEAEILDLMLVIHADHGGGNNSTYTTHCVTSTDTDTYSAFAAAIGALKGPKHGGANAKVMAMMDEIKKSVKNWDNDGQIIDYLSKIVKKEKGDGSGLIYGMGHAVYTKSDPRAVILKEKAQEFATVNGRMDEFNLYIKVAELTPEVFKEVKGIEKVLAPNVDFFSGFVYDNFNFPKDIYTPLFAMSRVAGWSAHRIEEIISGKKIIRPASIYVGPKNKSYIPLEERIK